MIGLLSFPIANLPEGYEFLAVLLTVLFGLGLMIAFGRMWER